MNFALITYTLVQREMVRFFRQKNRILGALGTPLVFWFLLGSGFSSAFRLPLPLSLEPTARNLNYMQFFFPGTILLTLLFTAIFSTISIIEDRREGFLQGILVAPVPRSSLVLGKLLGGAILATIQGILFYILTPFLGLYFGFGNFLYSLLVIFVISFGLTGLGFLIAWRLDSTQGFHAIMNLFLMPLWLLSGSVFPIEGVPSWLKFLMNWNPLTYANAGLHLGFSTLRYPNSILSSKVLCLAIILVFSVMMFWFSVKIAEKE